LDHDADFKPVFTNASIHQLAETLLAFLHFGEAVRAVSGEDMGYDEAFTDEQFNSLAQRITAIDEEALRKVISGSRNSRYFLPIGIITGKKEKI
jgi:hypothetical protein